MIDINKLNKTYTNLIEQHRRYGESSESCLLRLFLSGCEVAVKEVDSSVSVDVYGYEECLLSNEDYIRIIEALRRIDDSIEFSRFELSFLDELLIENRTATVKDLEVLTELKYLKSLSLWGFEVREELDDYSFLGKLDLECLSLSDSNIFNLESVSNLPRIKELQLETCGNIKSLSGVEKLTTLENLAVYDCNKLWDISAVVTLPNLKHLDIRDNRECDYHPIETMANKPEELEYGLSPTDEQALFSHLLNKL